LSPLARGTSRSLRQGVPRKLRHPVVPLRKGDKRSQTFGLASAGVPLALPAFQENCVKYPTPVRKPAAHRAWEFLTPIELHLYC
jgi:hypothetical protein